MEKSIEINMRAIGNQPEKQCPDKIGDRRGRREMRKEERRDR
jgi:hypothetical protein